MELQTFAPKLTVRVDNLSRRLTNAARGSLIIMAALLPFFFIPGTPILLPTSKIFMVLAFVLAAVAIGSLSILRRGTLSLSFPTLLLAWWGVVLFSFVSALLSPTLKLSLIGTSIEPQTVGFLFVMGAVMTLSLIFSGSKKSLMVLLTSLVAGAALLSLFHILRLLLGGDTLSLGVLANNSATLIGGWNDLGIFLAMGVIMVLVSLVQLPLPRVMVILMSLFVLPMLMMLAVINFFMLWIILGFVSLTVLVYSLVRDRFTQTDDSASTFTIAIVSAVVFVTAVFNVLGGGAVSSWVSQKTGIDHIEVRPSTSATLEIMRGVYQENAFTGIGPNRFADAWRQHKNQSINETVFWNTQFTSGSGYIPTWFVTTGIFGVLGWFLFLAIFFYTGFMTLMRSQSTDRFWFYIATISYISAAFLWLVALIYVPGPAVLIMAALTTGIMLVAGEAISSKPKSLSINFLANPRTGFVLIAGVMIAIIATVSLGYGVVRQFAALYTYVHATDNLPAEGNQINVVSARIASAYNMFRSDAFARDIAVYQLAYLNNLLSLPEPSAEDQQAFQSAIGSSVQAANEAIARSPHDSRNYMLLGDIMMTLAAVDIDGAADRAKEAYNHAKLLDPKNPYYDKQLAILAFKAGQSDEARRLAGSALALKSNYTDALFILSQMDIAEGDIKAATARTESIVAFESANPGRYYQLGVLYAADKNHQSAIGAFSRALEINPSYANARYLRAIQYLALGDEELAISELKLVAELNPDNAVLNETISRIQNGDIESILNDQADQISEPTTTNDEITTSSEVPDTDLLTPVNTVPTDRNNNNSDETAEDTGNAE